MSETRYDARMASTLNLDAVKITDGSGQVFEKARIRMPHGTNSASIVKAGQTLEARTDVVAVTKTQQTGAVFVWQISFGDGSVWEVERNRKGCGCGSR